jgi:ParB-like chromosome segregation protein Spo0J
MDLLEESIRSDGITMAIVVMRDSDNWTVVDGFHRRSVAAERLGRKMLPCVELPADRADRMASTVRHNRARGRHEVELFAAIVRDVLAEGWDEGRTATELGVSPEELLRLRQIVGAARALASPEYGRAWGGRDGEHRPDK